MEKLMFTKKDYDSLEWRVGADRDEDGKRLVVIDGKCIGDIDSVIDLLTGCKDQFDKNDLFDAFKAGSLSKDEAILAVKHPRPYSLGDLIAKEIKRAERNGLN